MMMDNIGDDKCRYNGATDGFAWISSHYYYRCQLET